MSDIIKPVQIIYNEILNIHLATFKYAHIFHYDNGNNMQQGKNIFDVLNGTHFIVEVDGFAICKVNEKDFPEIERITQTIL